MAKTFHFQATGFYLISKLDESGVIAYTAAAVTILKGDALHTNGSGAVTNATTAFASTFAGIAAEPIASGEVGLVIPPLRKYRFAVPVEEDALITTAAIGTICDLQSVNTIDISDVTGAANALGFFVDEIDVSTAAVAANTYGYAIGHFVAHTA